ncbi:SGNH/GDSL hydrolase family protein [Deinococcus navajonensis]|uniref:SGNH/GDSL hydrolase family protein n=1 Tax=Deinococcus navajonensis TaxID=309884 RepID=A0ABV8XUJ5_9DEIO
MTADLIPFTPPNPAPIVADRRNPSVAFEGQIPGCLDWLRTQPAYTANSVIGVIITARDTQTSFRVDGQPPVGTPGNFTNYILTPLVGSSTSTEPPPTSIDRTGPIINAQTLTDLDYVRWRLRPTVNIPVTSVLIENATISGRAAIAFATLNGGPSFVAPAVQEGPNVRAPVTGQLLAGTDYYLHLGKLGNGIDGTAYDGDVPSITLSSGHTWAGLTIVEPYVRYWTSFESQAAGKQIAFQLSTGDMSGTDRSGVTIRGTAPVTVDYAADTRTYTVGLGTGALSGEYARTSGTPVATLTTDYDNTYGFFQPSAQAAIAGYDFGGLDPATVTSGLVWEKPLNGNWSLVVRVNGVVSENGRHTVRLPAPLVVQPGHTYALGLAGGFSSAPQQQFTDGDSYVYAGFDYLTGRYFSTTGTYNAPISTQGEGGGMDAAPDVRIFAEAGARLQTSNIAGLTETLADHAQRLTTLEARPTWTSETLQDLVGAMLPQGTYDDAAGTVTYTFTQPRTDEEIQDVVAALIQAGANVTRTYDDAGNVLTLSATGSTASTTETLTGDPDTLTTADLSSDAWRALSPAAAPLVQSGAGTGTAFLVNPKGDAPATAYLAAGFTAPAGVTSVALSLRASAASAQTVVLELWNKTTNASLGTQNVALTGAATTFTLTQTVTPGHELHARLHVNGNGATAQAAPLVEFLRVTPAGVAGSSFWAASRRVEALASRLHGFVTDTPHTGLYQPGTPYAGLIVDTEADTIGVELYNVPSAAHYNHATVLVNGEFYAKVTHTQAGINLTQLALPAGQKRVELRAGGQEGTSLTALTGTYLRALYVPKGGRSQVVLPPRTVDVVILSDSNAAGSPGMARPGVEAWPQRLKPRRTVQAETVSMSGLYSWALGTGGLERLARRLTALRPQAIILAHSNNDWAAGPTVDATWTASRFGTEYGNLLDLLARLAPATRVLAMTSTPVQSDPTPEPYRAAIRTAVSTRPWVTLIEGSSLLTMADVEGDGVHIMSRGAAKIARSIQDTLDASTAQALPPGSMVVSSSGPVALSTTRTTQARRDTQHYTGVAGGVSTFSVHFRVDTAFSFDTVRQAIKGGSGETVRMELRSSDASGTLGPILASTPNVIQDGTMKIQDWVLSSSVTTTAGTYYHVYYVSNGANAAPGQNTSSILTMPQAGEKVTWDGGMWNGSFAGGNWYAIGFEFMQSVNKGTVGPSFTTGATSARPVTPMAGDQHYDTTLSKPVWWNGAAWKDAAGTTV